MINRAASVIPYPSFGLPPGPDGRRRRSLRRVNSIVDRVQGSLITRGEGNRAFRESGIFPEVLQSSCG
jgi:hypothetical protein